MKWFPLHSHSHFSLLDGLSKPEQIANRIWECGYEGSAITDHGSISGIPPLYDAMNSICKGCGKINKSMCKCEKYEQAKLKTIFGCEFYICQKDASIRTIDNKELSHLCVLAKSDKGWKNLIKASSASHSPEFSYRKPRLDIERLGTIGEGEFITFSGHMGSDLANACFSDYRFAYGARTYDDARNLVDKDWKNKVFDGIARYQKAFGKENFYLEIQLVDHTNLPASLVVANILRWAGKKLDVPCVATADSHYCRKEDAADQRILLCSALDTTLKEIQKKLDRDEDVSLGAFFKSNNYHIPSIEEMVELHKDHPEELENACKIAERCNSCAIGGKPLLPVFSCPEKQSPEEYLKKLCISGWDKKIVSKVKKDKLPEYFERLWVKEYPTIRDAGLSSYFLITQDFIKYANNKLKVKTGLGRGSGAGCLVSYLTDITKLDPIPLGLIFERFYNAGRNSPGRIALPDIDSDFPIKSREKVIDYIRDKYGKDRVCQMATFSRMQGRGALKDVLRAHERCSFEEMNRITENIPDESEIIDQLQEMREETGEASIIRWALENTPDLLKEWATLNENGEIEGPLSLDFAQAIRLEGTKRNIGKHASGLIICSEKISDICPMVWDKSSEEMMVGVDMRDAEKMGLVKFDILGLRALDCIIDSESIIRTGVIDED